MEFIQETLQQILDPNWIMKNGGLYLVLLILFIETGVFFGFFLPGDPLLFISGMIIASAGESVHLFPSDMMNLGFWMTLFITSTILGNFFGYWFGSKFGHSLRNKKDNWFFKRKHIDTAHQFYEKKGGLAIIIARFLPMVRTFAPIIGGMVEMNFKKFSFYNVVGAVLWVISIVSLGYIFGDNEWVKSHLEIIILGFVVLVSTPVVIKMIPAKAKTN